jgi:glyoxylate reductase
MTGPGSVPERPRVVVAQPLPAAGLEPLRSRFDVVVTGPRPSPADLRRLADGAAALVADPTVQVDAELLDTAGTKLEVVANFAVGYDNIDFDACRERGVIVTNTPDVLTNATAELALALMLAAARGLGQAERILRRGGWRGWEPQQFLGRELAESTIGIVGLGRIGSRVAELLSGFGSRLIYSSRHTRGELESSLRLEHRAFNELLAEADLVTLHLSLNSDTRHLIDAESLQRFKRGAILVNTARGGLVDTDALISALRSGQLGAAALDVYENEPEVPAELMALENVVLAPHIGSATEPARDGMARLVAENVIAVLDGREPVTPVS